MYGGEHHSIPDGNIYDSAFGQMRAVGIADEDVAMQHLALFPWIADFHNLISLVLHDVEQTGIRQAKRVCPSLRLAAHAGSAG